MKPLPRYGTTSHIPPLPECGHNTSNGPCILDHSHGTRGYGPHLAAYSAKVTS